jgi:hypothetical protein
MVRPFRHLLLLLLLVLYAVQFIGTACSDDCLRQWSTGPLHAHDQIPGATDGQTESDGNQGEGELELGLAQGDAFRIIQPTGACILDNALCPRDNFSPDLFRPPTVS